MNKSPTEILNEFSSYPNSDFEMDKLQFGIILCALIIFNSSGISALKDIEIKELICENNKEVSENITCRVGVDHGKKHVLDLSCTLKKEVKDIIVNVQVFKKDGEQMLPIVNATEDFCSFMASKSASFYIEMIMKMLRDKSNIDHQCPYSGYLYANGINPDPTLIPPGIPDGEYIINVLLYEFTPSNYLGHIKIVAALTG